MTDDARRDRSPVPPAGGALGRADPWQFLSAFTQARIGLGRCGGSVPTAPLLQFQLAHARARDAVHRTLDPIALAAGLGQAGFDVLHLASAAPDRRTFIARPDLGRILSDASRATLEQRPPAAVPYDVAFVVTDGLSALAVERHALPFLAQIAPRLAAADWRIAPVCIVEQGRVAVADEVGALLPARMTVILVGERPGLSSPDSLGLYLTWDPLPGRSNAERNCISNVREPDGLAYAVAAHKLFFLLTEARRRKLSGVDLKEDAAALEAPDTTAALPPG
ncbi:MAG: ethanolamine ammonia-lyase subunit EutC [Burkholderiales bacterium]|nr:ethanolamine ammonia-lyase subunit EutC [Burkholderiales bacterium]